MRVLSANAAKHRSHKLTPSAPQQGSGIGVVWALLQANKGRAVHRPDGMKKVVWEAALGQLRDFWGLDINRPGTSPMLVGEWFGKVYVDYLAEALDHEARRDA